MTLRDSLEIGLENGLKTVNEAIYNISSKASELFEKYESPMELKQLFNEWILLRAWCVYPNDVSITEVLSLLKVNGITTIDTKVLKSRGSLLGLSMAS